MKTQRFVSIRIFCLRLITLVTVLLFSLYSHTSHPFADELVDEFRDKTGQVSIVTDNDNSIKSVGWNDVAKGQMPCSMRSLDGVINDFDSKVYSSYERNDALFRKKAKARMNGIRTGNHGCTDDLFHIQIALCRWPRSDTDCFVRQLCVKAFLICLRINRHCGNSHFSAGTDNTHRDLASVGDQ